eukprot:GSChrysophyteH2.ASY1.ANO1.810.1 assembled CDS
MLAFSLRMLFQLAKGYIKPPVITKKRTVDVAFRCWPIDIDVYGHMNNACYLRVAELARWHIFPATGLLASAAKTRMMFLAVDQKITYVRPIRALKKYVIETKLDVYKDDKWVWYTHTFLQHPDNIKPGSEQKVYAKIELRAVMKEVTGKTIKPRSTLQLEDTTDFVRDLYDMHSSPKAI